jgi:hypothetical protein
LEAAKATLAAGIPVASEAARLLCYRVMVPVSETTSMGRDAGAIFPKVNFGNEWMSLLEVVLKNFEQTLLLQVNVKYNLLDNCFLASLTCIYPVAIAAFACVSFFCIVCNTLLPTYHAFTANVGEHQDARLIAI